ncbi:MAG: tRNA (guanosine(37)-N1)-methyltransferase TrmD [Bacteroidetes bacterium]|nr:tRNA (guanosine(37)-N1)-methyltransferase TrmD [Bacteroidota bacterium]MBL7103343.1 tRNA (guanosine(37)-N1)-methyltransferase TrmD [Bacteroidales bacterium]
MRIDILTIFPEMFDGPFKHSILKRAQERGLVEINLINIRDYATDKHKRVDDYQYGGGSGMVMMVEPIANCIEDLKLKNTYNEIIYMSPDGELFGQQMANRYSIFQNLMILCGHYKGIDERIREHFITKEISIGNYVLSGGELGAAVFADAIVRLLPGVLNDETSALSDSFQDGLLSPPAYTRPYNFKSMKVPDILLSGNDKEIEKWRMEKAIERTKVRRPEMTDDEE